MARKSIFAKDKLAFLSLFDGRLSPEWIFMRFSRIFGGFASFGLFQSILADFGQLQLISAIESVTLVLEEA